MGGGLVAITRRRDKGKGEKTNRGGEERTALEKKEELDSTNISKIEDPSRGRFSGEIHARVRRERTGGGRGLK